MKKSAAMVCVLFGVLLLISSSLSSLPAATESGSVLWKHQIGGQIWSSLKHHQGILYFGSDNNNFYAVDTQTRKIKWQFKSGGIIRAAAHIAKNHVFFASDDGFLYALQLETGKPSWKFDLGSADLKRRLPAVPPPYEYDYLHSSPVYHNDLIYIGSANGMLYAIDPQTGKERWHFETKNKIRSTPVTDTKNIYFGSWDGKLYAVDAESGLEVWQFDCGGIVQGSPAFGAGKIFVGSRSTKIFAVDVQTGKAAWTYVHVDGSWVESSPVFRDGIVYIGSSDSLKLFAFDAETGKLIWSRKTGGWSWSTPVLSKNLVYIGGISAFPYYFEGISLEAGFYAVEQQTGNIKWRMTPGATEGYVTGGVFASPVIVGGIVYVGALDGYIYALKE